jgi:hypothetical protein
MLVIHGQAITLSQNLKMVYGVPENDVDKCASTGTETIRRPDARPRSGGMPFASAKVLARLGDKLVHSTHIKLAFWCTTPFVKPWHRGDIAAADSNQPISKDSFRI